MITLKDSIEIKTAPERIFDWFKNLDKNFTEWHPNHKKFVKITGCMDEGDVVYFEEQVDGKWYKIKCKVTKIEKRGRDWRIEVKSLFPGSLFGVRILFITETKENACIFTHIETFGFKTFSSWFRIDLVRKDMEEDGKRLKEILERERA